MAAVWRLIPPALVLAAGAAAQTADVPELPDLSAAEPQVRAVITEAHQALRGEPDSAQRWGRYASLLDVHSYGAQAATAYEVAAGLNPDEFRWPYQRALLLSAEDPAASVALLERALQLNDGYAPLHLQYGTILQRMGRMKEAAHSYRRALLLDDGNAHAHAALGRLLLDEGDIEGARSQLERCELLDPDCRPGLTGLAAYHRMAGHAQEAQEYARRAAEAPDRPAPDEVLAQLRHLSVGTTAVLRRVQLLREVGRPGDAAAMLRELLADNPDSARAMNTLGDILLEEKDAAGALEQFQMALAAAPDFVPAELGLAQALTRMGRLDEARRRYENVLSEHPSSVRAYTGLGACLAQQGLIEQAGEQMRRAYELAPENQRARVGYGWALYYLGDYAAALETLEPVAADARDPLDEITIEAIGHSGLALLMLGRDDEAIERLGRAVDAAPQRADLRRGLAAAHEKIGGYRRAVEVLEWGLRLDPRDGQMALMLARLLATSPQESVRDGARAVQIAERLAQATGRRNPEILGALACAYAETGRYEEAARTAARAVAIARESDQSDLVDMLEQQLAAFKAGRPWRGKSHQPSAISHQGEEELNMEGHGEP